LAFAVVAPGAGLSLDTGEVDNPLGGTVLALEEVT
jgi:hypothetical protein